MIEYVDARERSQLSVAFDCNDVNNGMKAGGRFSHMEIHPYLQFGVSSSLIPFIENNQSPRNQFQSSMGKQGIQCFYDPRKMVYVCVEGNRSRSYMFMIRCCCVYPRYRYRNSYIMHNVPWSLRDPAVILILTKLPNALCNMRSLQNTWMDLIWKMPT